MKKLRDTFEITLIGSQHVRVNYVQKQFVQMLHIS